MKTKYIKIFTIIAALATLSACSDFLQVKPQGQIVLDDFWKSESDVDAVIATCYKELLSYDNMEKFMVWGELRSDNLTGTFGVGIDEMRILDGNILPKNSYASWAGMYTLINYCNSVIYYAPKVIDPNFTQTELRAKMAEALTLRSLAYFYLVRVFRDVPLILEPSLSDSQDYNVTQSTENQVLDRLETDLLLAEQWAMTVYGKKAYNKGRITKNAVRALLADVYLWRNKYTETIALCDKIIIDPTLVLIKADENPYTEIFGVQNSTESIFETQFDFFSNAYNAAVFNFYGSSTRTRGSLSASLFMIAENSILVYPLTDVRRKDFIKSDLPDESGFYGIFKYTGALRYENTEGRSTYLYRSSEIDSPNWIFYRLTDIMLMKAEALSQLYRDNTDKNMTMQLVNTVYLRSNPTLTDSLSIDSYSTKKDLEELVMLERQRELMFEGKRWFDLMRIARRDGKTDRLIKDVTRKSAENASIISSKLKDMNSIYMPIHEDEIKANKNLKQNPFYLTDSY